MTLDEIYIFKYGLLPKAFPLIYNSTCRVIQWEKHLTYFGCGVKMLDCLWRRKGFIYMQFMQLGKMGFSVLPPLIQITEK